MLRKRKHEHVLRSLNCVNCDDVVGSGTFGVVFKATEKETGDIVALKRIKMEKESNGFPITVSSNKQLHVVCLITHHNLCVPRKLGDSGNKNPKSIKSREYRTIEGNYYIRR